MVGNVSEWVADWVPMSTASPGWGVFSGDHMSLSGASTTATTPAALLRGGTIGFTSSAGPLYVAGDNVEQRSCSAHVMRRGVGPAPTRRGA